MKFWFTLPGKKFQPAEVLVEGGGNAKQVVEEGSNKYKL